LPDDSRERARFLGEAVRAFLLKRPSRLMRNVVPRVKMLTAVLSRGHLNPWVSPLLVYLDQVESIAQGSSGSSARPMAKPAAGGNRCV